MHCAIVEPNHQTLDNLLKYVKRRNSGRSTGRHERSLDIKLDGQIQTQERQRKSVNKMWKYLVVAILACILPSYTQGQADSFSRIPLPYLFWWLPGYLDNYSCLYRDNPHIYGCLPEVCKDNPIDLAFIVDGSGSICDNDPTRQIIDNQVTCNNWRSVVNFISGAVDRLNIGAQDAQIALVTFADKGSVYFNFGE
ncbi:hypothetical protein LSH36_122g02004 [Paralvinella palmiformis]|uniref:VWFA domain-containing protein n=1 Tax=Paralvinella palmiformis TaxID=53620 RepID=A0AAD9JXN9_9ANNE|nr:hypothetical protein LSH36_122g02004 [Paralvinella palmiformis]